MADQNPPELQDRLDNFQHRNAKKPRSRIGVGAIAAGLGLGGAALAYVFASSLQDAADPLQTSDVESFQDQRTGNGGRLEFPADEEDQRVEDALIAVEEALEPQVAEPVPDPVPDETVLRELAALREALAASQSARNSEIQAAVSDLREAFDAQTDALEASIAEKDDELAAAARQNAARLSGLQAMLDAERAQRESLESELTQSSLIADQRLLEERRRLEEEDRARAAAQEADELLRAQIVSPAVVFAGGAGTSGQNAPPGSGATLASEPRGGVGENEDYLLRAARPLQIDEAARMEYPDRTLAQGSVVQAALQTAINSDLPGNVVAVVSEPVLAFSGERVLIPRGSRLFGQYRSGIDINQKRILILWTRILTPDGISMEIASAGGDQLGRSGLTGLVDTKFMERFGGAALISVIGAAPSVAAEAASDETTSIVLESVGEDLQDAVGSVIAEQIAITPTIYVDQGANVTVLVDRDVVIFD
ncbi:type IV secretion system protein B10 [Sulfitobacter sp. EhC04]|uniref:TrbI/VirB10 family protein n=1 Tax=Sulfitobacter sp. EhC04 TaxID=1849168 RepID=UPI0007F336C7|nr:TrbI/VirB10 family protein [Sulfitobacter sp. EhC04]OAN72691.1 type IV secretion system protein B10 [Sulfitobacter sp. EhC04]